MKRVGATTICKHMIFESKAFVFDKTPTGKIRFMPKERQHASLKGFSPDLLDNIIMKCGTAYSVCYEAIAQRTGRIKHKFGANDILDMLNNNQQNKPVKNYEQQERIKINSEKILNILSTI